MTKLNPDHRLLLSDKDVAHLLSLSISWVRVQRLKRKRGEEHVLDVAPVQLGAAVRYRYHEFMEWFDRYMASNDDVPAKRVEPRVQDRSRFITSVSCQQTINVGDDVENISPWSAENPIRTIPSQMRGTPATPPPEKSDKHNTRKPNARARIKLEGCRYIEGDPKVETQSCGDELIEGSSYCEKHHAVCYEKSGGKNGK